ncbi:MAG: hypothetical protein ABIX01_13000 [Chitinophagaceae bacterium]
MSTIFNYVAEQYELVRQSRKALFGFCETMDPGDFIEPNSSFGRGGSARNLLVHISNVYQYWIG